ncbi:MAG: hypothetical protein O7G84_00845 [Gammaproteobacteria bacterium]|nr:hypothetical protein [Gammaproteobacteria bacterium]
MTDHEQAKAFLTEAGARFPEPWMGEPFIHVEAAEEVDTQVIRYGPPCRPGREIYEWDEIADTDVYVRTLSDEEFDAELAQYNRDVKQWSKDGGQKIVVNGPPKLTATFRTAGGSWCEGIWTSIGWQWTAWEIRG